MFAWHWLPPVFSPLVRLGLASDEFRRRTGIRERVQDRGIMSGRRLWLRLRELRGSREGSKVMLTWQDGSIRG